MEQPSYHLSAAIPWRSVEYLEWLGLEAKRTGGLRLPKAMILRALLNVAMQANIDVSGVTTQEELEDRIWEGLGKELNLGKGRMIKNSDDESQFLNK